MGGVEGRGGGKWRQLDLNDNKEERKKENHPCNPSLSWYRQESQRLALTGVAQLAGYHPTKQKVTSLIPAWVVA